MRRRGNYCIIRGFILGEGGEMSQCGDMDMCLRLNILMLCLNQDVTRSWANSIRCPLIV
jgi:hypothetical protein